MSSKGIYVQRAGGGREYYRIPIRPSQFFQGKIEDADVYQGVSGVGPAVFAVCYPEGLQRPLLTIIDCINHLVFEKAGEKEGLSYSTLSGTVASFNHLEIKEENEYLVIEGREIVRGEKEETVEGYLKMKMEKELKENTYVEIQLELKSNNGSTVIERKGQALYNDTNKELVLENTKILLGEEFFH